MIALHRVFAQIIRENPQLRLHLIYESILTRFAVLRPILIPGSGIVICRKDNFGGERNAKGTA